MNMGNLRAMYFAIILIVSTVVSTSKELVETRKFPKNFLFGVSTAAYQIEGAWNVSGKGENIWDRLVHTNPDAIVDKTDADVTCDSYNQYRRDVEMLQELGVDFYRFSISWSRLLPTGFTDNISKDGVEYYNNLINTLIAKDIMPMVTLYHWDLPQSLQDLGGWPNPLLADYYEDYARVVFRTFGDRVKLWITFNEPKEFCLEGYGEKSNAPLLNSSGIGDYMCSHTVLLAHARAYRLYDKEFRKNQNGHVGITLNAYWNEPATLSTDDIHAAERAIQFNFGWFAHPIFSRSGDYPYIMRKRIEVRSAHQKFLRSRLPAFTKAEVVLISGSADFLGLNHYSTRMSSLVEQKIPETPSFRDDCGVQEFFDSSWPGSASSWLKVVPWGFRKVLNWIKEEYRNITVIVTENGFSTKGGLKDTDRVSYMRQYLNALLDAIEDGCNIKGYTAWSLMDNFEWLRGYSERFGLYEVDFSSPDRTRKIRDSGKMFAEVIKSKSIRSVTKCPSCDEIVPPLYNINAIIV